MTDDRNARRLDTGGLVQGYTPSHQRQASVPAQPRGVTTRPAPEHMALPQHIDDEQEAPPAPPAGRGQERAADTVILAAPVMVHNEPVQVVKFRRPNPGDLRQCGYPFRNMINSETKRIESIEMNADAIFRYIVALSDPQLPPSSVEAMSLRDFESCTQIVIGFFQE